MAKKDENKVSSKMLANVNKLANNIQQIFNRTYIDNYYNNDTNKKDLENIHNGINGAINNILKNNSVNTGMSSLTSLYTAVSKGGDKDDNLTKNVKQLFEQDATIDNLMNIYAENKYVKDLDDEIDTICKYMPQLEEALDILKENVLSSEQFNKEFMYMNNMSGVDNKEFSSNIEKLKEVYNLEEKIEDIYYRTSKYGETFYYVKPYSEGLADLLNNSDARLKAMAKARSMSIGENTLIFEQSTDLPIPLNLSDDELKSISDMNIRVTMEHDMFINEAAKNKNIYDSVMSYKSGDIKKQYDDLVPDSKFVTQDGITDPKAVSSSQVKVSGCIVKELPREKVIPIYIDSLCLGYFYIDCDTNTLDALAKSAADPTLNIKRTTNMAELQNSTSKDNALMHIASKMASAIDANFINSHADFKKEIYHILKYNADHGDTNVSNIKVTYLPPDDVFHFYFRKDPKTHRGISDLQKSIIPAKLYTSLYITNTLGIITRGQDKRAYYVRQSIDTNIASILLNTINQIKKGNFGMRDINNLNNFINITGRFNDMIIPEGPNGDPPVRMEIIQGQDIQPKTELMEILENMAVNVTGVPIEAVQARHSQLDFAAQVTTNNAKLLRKAYKRQSQTQNMCNPFLTKIYNCEYGVSVVVEMTLPPPRYLNNQQIDLTIENALNTGDKYATLAYGDSKEGVDPLEIDLFKDEMLRQEYAGIIPWDRIDRAKQKAAIRLKEVKNKKNDEE